MNARLSLQMLAAAMQRDCADADQQLLICDAVATLAPLLPAETTEDVDVLLRMETDAKALATTIRATETLQLNFRALLDGTAGGNGK